MTTKQEQISLVSSILDVDLIHKVMNHLGIKWNDTATNVKRVPTKEEIRKIAELCMNNAWESKDKFFAIGGFEAEVIEGVIGIKFIITQANPLSRIFS
jgi:hypothetical protein